mmetsp:Transcript_32581/g.74936  ORF Transcript_32581/g.74936 Transcript_32581/m.74936 type:complete len:200 (-) Transcript_32581:262-861(-)
MEHMYAVREIPGIVEMGGDGRERGSHGLEILEKKFVLTCHLFVCVFENGIVPSKSSVRLKTTALGPFIPEEEQDDQYKTMVQIVRTWAVVKHLDREEVVEKYDQEWVDAYDRFYKKWDHDIERAKQLCERMEKFYAPPPKTKKKPKGQKRRERWELVKYWKKRNRQRELRGKPIPEEDKWMFTGEEAGNLPFHEPKKPF